MTKAVLDDQITRTTRPGDASSQLKKDVDSIKYVIYALVVVLFLGFAGMFVAVSSMMLDSLSSKEASYQQLQEEVGDQNDRIEELTRALKQ